MASSNLEGVGSGMTHMNFEPDKDEEERIRREEEEEDERYEAEEEKRRVEECAKRLDEDFKDFELDDEEDVQNQARCIGRSLLFYFIITEFNHIW